MEVGDFLGDSVLLVRSEKELGCCSQKMQWVILLSICYSLQLIIYKKIPQQHCLILRDEKESTNRAQARSCNIEERGGLQFSVFTVFIFVEYATISSWHHRAVNKLIVLRGRGCLIPFY